MRFLALILLLNIGHLRAQADTYGTCTIWGDPHLVGFPADPFEAPFRSGYWCRWAGRMLVVKNTFIEFFVNVTDLPFWNEFFEVSLFYNETKLCTITPNSITCLSEFVRINSARNDPNNIQIFYDVADLELSINSQWFQSRNVYHIQLTQNYALILNSTGLCINRRRECILETSGRRKRGVNIATATEVCDVFVAEANKTAKQLVGDTISSMTTHAREACITDISLTGDVAWGKSAVWFILTDSIQQAPISREQKREKMANISSSISEAVAGAQPRAEVIMGISTTTTATALFTTITTTTESIMNTSIVTSSSSLSTSTIKPSRTTSSSNTIQFMHNFIFLFLMLSIKYINFY